MFSSLSDSFSIFSSFCSEGAAEDGFAAADEEALADEGSLDAAGEADAEAEEDEEALEAGSSPPEEVGPELTPRLTAVPGSTASPAG